MTSWTIILCEGPHDQAALVWLAQICGDWDLLKKTALSALPEPIQALFPLPTKSVAGQLSREKLPQYLRTDDRYLVVYPLGGAEKVLGRP